MILASERTHAHGWAQLGCCGALGLTPPDHGACSHGIQAPSQQVPCSCSCPAWIDTRAWTPPPTNTHHTHARVRLRRCAGHPFAWNEGRFVIIGCHETVHAVHCRHGARARGSWMLVPCSPCAACCTYFLLFHVAPIRLGACGLPAGGCNGTVLMVAQVLWSLSSQCMNAGLHVSAGAGALAHCIPEPPTHRC